MFGDPVRRAYAARGFRGGLSSPCLWVTGLSKSEDFFIFFLTFGGCESIRCLRCRRLCVGGFTHSWYILVNIVT